ncbi:hypothetical protein Ssi03_65240 [Sphaerisporangium siamense]|uniref:Secreted protein n=1 Tax=Sphaerisporangium siamense TaxID=795645 RepID=A0A7W7D2I8_9ACTN|nr:hypothetical protein [Sphaerisporangium siamense]MBB4698941.1 hypothetical protein [Sphaerisporangium siamense]GII88534.1 hypothetical protein Ssi03_65240 [Sphaerisporangium siamense]
MKITRWGASGVTLTAVAALTLVSSTPAQALPQGSCGASYRKVATYSISHGAKDGKAYGTVTLYQSPTAHRKCAIARVATSYIGKTSYMYVSLLVDRNRNKKYDAPDIGVADGSPKYKWFAGPVFAPADRLCVQVTGTLRIGSQPTVEGGTPTGKWKHCG